MFPAVVTTLGFKRRVLANRELCLQLVLAISLIDYFSKMVVYYCKCVLYRVSSLERFMLMCIIWGREFAKVVDLYKVMLLHLP